MTIDKTIHWVCPACGACNYESGEETENGTTYKCVNCGAEKTTAPRRFETGAIRDNSDGKGRMDLLPWNAIRELSKHCERGAAHYGEGNVRKGIPMHSLMDSAARHLAQYISGDNAEPYHLVATLWNVAWAVEQQTTHPELNDLPWQKSEDDNG